MAPGVHIFTTSSIDFLPKAAGMIGHHLAGAEELRGFTVVQGEGIDRCRWPRGPCG